MKRPKELKFKSKGAVLVSANGRPVTYWHASRRFRWLARLYWIMRRVRGRR